MIEKIKTQEPEDSQSNFFTDKEGRSYGVKMIPDEKEGLLVEVKNGTSRKMKLLPREWEVFREKRGLEIISNIKPKLEKVDFNILEVKGGDILEMSDGSYLKILENDPINKEVTFEQISPDMDTSKKGEVKSRGYDIFSVYQDEIKDYLPGNKTQEPTSKPKKAKGNNGKDSLNNEVSQDLMSKKRERSTRWGDSEEEKARNGEKNNADKILDDLDTTPPEDLNLQEVSDWEPGVLEEALETNETPIVQKLKRGRPKKVVETPPVIKQSLEEAGKIMADLEKPKKEVPLNLKRGDVIWNEHNDEIVVLDVVTEPVNEKEALMNGYVLLGFEPKPGRNDEFIEEKVPFSKLEKRKNKIFLTEQIPFVEIDEEAEQEEKTPKFESTAFADLQASLEQEPPPLPAEYLAKVEAEKRLAEGRRLAQLREEISHGDLGADLAKDWTPTNVEMPKRESPALSNFAKKAVKKSWWQRLLGL